VGCGPGAGGALQNTAALGSSPVRATRRHAALFFHQTEQQVLGANGGLVGAFRLLVCQAQDPPCALREAFHSSHVMLSSAL
jgi:hypothetical protein